MNKVILVGKIFKEPEVKYTTAGQLMIKVTVKTSESYKDKSTGETKWNNEFHRVTLWGPRWEKFANILAESKDKEAVVEGKITYSSYEKNGKKEYSTDIVADSFNIVR